MEDSLYPFKGGIPTLRVQEISLSESESFFGMGEIKQICIFFFFGQTSDSSDNLISSLEEFFY